MKRDGEGRDGKESKHQWCCDRKKMLLSAQLKSDCLDTDRRRREAKKKGPILLQTASGFRVGARVAEIWRERHTCHPNEIILQGCWGKGELHRDEILQSVNVCVLWRRGSATACLCVFLWSETSRKETEKCDQKNCLLIISRLLRHLLSHACSVCRFIFLVNLLHKHSVQWFKIISHYITLQRNLCDMFRIFNICKDFSDTVIQSKLNRVQKRLIEIPEN